ncbi:MAG: ribosome small subunit-dependent GTPase A [Planctomycetes bacterium]|nr:ribosome small subunit-dependent GTPase A [Planctomycetota bacterium]
MSEADKERQRRRYERAQRHVTSHEEDKARKANRRTRGRWRDEDDADAEFAKMHRRPPGGTTPAVPTERDHFVPNSAELVATVVWLGRGRARVLADDGEHVAMLAPAIASTQRHSIAIGDVAVLHERRGAEPVVVAVQPRRSELARSDGEHGERHVLAANVDIVVLVLTAGRLRTGLVDRLLTALADSGAHLLVCVNKCDLPHDATARDAELAPYRARGVAILQTSALGGDGIEELSATLAGATAAFVGHSGVGKSTLLNRLDPDADRATAEVREQDGRGRHTTTASSLRRLADGTQLVDTPGVRLFGLVAEASDAAAAFPEIAELGAGCRFRDCRHAAEPGCAVRAAAADGTLPPARYESYLRLVGDGS